MVIVINGCMDFFLPVSPPSEALSLPLSPSSARYIILHTLRLARDVIDSRQIDKSTFSLCQLNRIEWLGIESK